MVSNWGETKVLKDTIRERIVSFTLNQGSILPEQEDSTLYKMFLVTDGELDLQRRLGPIKSTYKLSKGQSTIVIPGCFHTVSNAYEGITKFIVVEQQTKFTP